MPSTNEVFLGGLYDKALASLYRPLWGVNPTILDQHMAPSTSLVLARFPGEHGFVAVKAVLVGYPVDPNTIHKFALSFGFRTLRLPDSTNQTPGLVTVETGFGRVPPSIDRALPLHKVHFTEGISGPGWITPRYTGEAMRIFGEPGKISLYEDTGSSSLTFMGDTLTKWMENTHSRGSDEDSRYLEMIKRITERVAVPEPVG